MKRYDQVDVLPRVIRCTAGTRPMAWLYGHIQEPLDRFVYRRTGGRATLTSWLGEVEMSMLTTTGAKTGKPRVIYLNEEMVALTKKLMERHPEGPLFRTPRGRRSA